MCRVQGTAHYMDVERSDSEGRSKEYAAAAREHALETLRCAGQAKDRAAATRERDVEIFQCAGQAQDCAAATRDSQAQSRHSHA